MVHVLLATLLLVGSVCPTLALLPGDRITASYRTMQGSTKSRWIDLDLPQLPRFQQYGTAMLMPVFDPSFDPSDDAKLFFTFADSKLIMPWTTMYSVKEISSLEKLVVTFVHDEFDVLQVHFQPLYGTNLDIISKASYPVMEIEYLWESVQEDDVTSGVRVLFFIGLLLTLYFTVTSCKDVPGAPRGRTTNSFHATARHDGLPRRKVAD